MFLKVVFRLHQSDSQSTGKSLTIITVFLDSETAKTSLVVFNQDDCGAEGAVEEGVAV